MNEVNPEVTASYMTTAGKYYGVKDSSRRQIEIEGVVCQARGIPRVPYKSRYLILCIRMCVD